MPVFTVSTLDEVAALRRRTAEAAATAMAYLHKLEGAYGPLEALARLRFEEVGRHPLEDRGLNLVEQINQTFTYLATFAAAEYLLDKHRNSAPLRLNLGATSGTDIESGTADLAAEVFAAVRRGNNGKLNSDIARVAMSGRALKYVFFFCPGDHCEPFHPSASPDVLVVPLSHNQIFNHERLAAQPVVAADAPKAARR